MKKLLLLCSLLFASLCWGQQSFSDTIIQLSAAQCPGSASGNGNTFAGTAGTGTGLQLIGATLTPVYQVDTTNSGTNTHSYVCELACPTRNTLGRGCNSMAGVLFFYGAQTNGPASQTLSTCFTVTFPTQGASESASTVGGAACGGTITQIPAVGSANLGTTTAGAFFSTYALFGTAVDDSNSAYKKSYVSFVFVGTATTATKTNTAGANIFTTQTIGWMKRHGKEASIDAMARIGIDRKTAGLIYAAYKSRGFHVGKNHAA